MCNTKDINERSPCTNQFIYPVLFSLKNYFMGIVAKSVYRFQYLNDRR